MHTTLVKFQIGRLKTGGSLLIDDLSKAGQSGLYEYSFPSGVYNVFIRVDGNRLGSVIQKVAITPEQRFPIVKHRPAEVVRLNIQSGFLMIGDFVSVTMGAEALEAEGHRAINRSHVRAAMLGVNEPSDRVELDVGRIVVLETGFGGGVFPLFIMRDSILLSFRKDYVTDRHILSSSVETPE